MRRGSRASNNVIADGLVHVSTRNSAASADLPARAEPGPQAPSVPHPHLCLTPTLPACSRAAPATNFAFACKALPNPHLIVCPTQWPHLPGELHLRPTLPLPAEPRPAEVVTGQESNNSPSCGR
eukprot:1156387-Pelagomonas_calceolata.AAC.4